MTSETFTTLALGWIAAAGTIGAAGIYGYFKLKSLYETIKAQSEQNSQRLDVHDANAKVNSAAIVANTSPTTTIPK